MIAHIGGVIAAVCLIRAPKRRASGWPAGRASLQWILLPDKRHVAGSCILLGELFQGLLRLRMSLRGRLLEPLEGLLLILCHAYAVGIAGA